MRGKKPEVDLTTRLELFVDRASRLRTCGYVTRAESSSWGLKWERDKGVEFTIQQPSEDLTRSFLVELRPILSKKEPIFIDRILNLCHQHLRHDQWQAWLLQSQQLWKTALSSSGLRILCDDREVSPGEIMDLWINGYYFHDDVEKRRILENLEQRVPFLSKLELHSVLDEASRHVFYVCDVVRAGLAEEYFDPTVR